MNSPDKNGKDDQSLDHDLGQLGQLYHSGESTEPPDMLDQAVLNKARRAAEPKNSWLDFGWIHGVTTVALVVLTFSIFTIQRETGEFEPSTGQSVNRTLGEVTGQLSAEAESDQIEVDQAETTTRDQDSSLREMRAPTSVAPASASAPNTDTLREKKQGVVEGQLKSTDKLDNASELEASQASNQQKMLDQILKQKLAGDDRWIEGLSDFRKLYPDFPIPEELRNKG